MALGNNNYQNRNQQNQQSEPSYYSRIRITNPTDNIGLNFTFWKGLLKVSIVESGNAQEGRSNELAYIHLSPTKARLMAQCVDKILSDEKSSDIYGINTGIGEVNGFMAIGRDMGNPYLIIAKVGQNGYESSQRFNFNKDYNYFLQVSDLDKLKFKKEYDNTVELTQFRDILEDFARASSGAIGASVHDIGRYEASKTNALVRKIAAKVGVELNYTNNQFGGNGNYSKPSGDSNNSKSQGNRYNNISDLEDEF